MIPASISFEATIHMVFSSEEVEAIFVCAAAHYDHFCKSACEPGGFMWGVKNQTSVGLASPMSFGELDTLAKILEMRDEIYAFDKKFAGKIAADVRGALQLLKKHTPNELDLAELKV